MLMTDQGDFFLLLLASIDQTHDPAYKQENTQDRTYKSTYFRNKIDSACNDLTDQNYQRLIQMKLSALFITCAKRNDPADPSDVSNDTCSFFIHFFSLRTLVLKKFCICKNCKYSHSEI